MKRNSFIDRKSYLAFLGSAILVSMSQNVAYITDPLFAGNNVCQEAIAAMNLYGPFLQLNFAFLLLFAQGSMILAANAFGNGDYDSIKKHFTVSITSMIFQAACVIALVFGFRHTIVDYLCPEHGLIHDLLLQYLSLMIFEMMTVGIYLTLNYFVSIDGHPEISGKSSLLLVIIQLSLAFTFSKYTNLGVRSFAAACIISESIAIVYLSKYLFSKECSFRPVSMKGEYFHYLKANVQKGAPQVIYNLAFMFALLIFNQSVQHVAGENGVQAWSFAYVPVSLGILLYNAASEVILSIGGVSLGEKNLEGLKYVFKASILFMAVSAILVILLSELFPDVVMKMLGCDDASLMNTLRWPFRCCVTIIIAFAFVQLKSLGFVVIGKDRMYSVLTSIINLFPPILVGLCALFFKEFFWWSFIVAVLLEGLLYLYMHRKFNHELNSLPDWDCPTIILHVNYGIPDIQSAMQRMEGFLQSDPRVTDEMINRMEHASEELLYNIIKHVPDKRKNDNLYFSVLRLTDSVDIIFKDAGRPFCPVITFQDKPTTYDSPNEKVKFALRLFNHYAVNPTYKFCYGLNVTRLSFKLNKSANGL